MALDIKAQIESLTTQMNEAAEKLQFEKAAEIRDKIAELKAMLGGKTGK
jgi:excinuclease ABC subunit B